MNTIRTSINSPLRIDTIALPGKRGQIGKTTYPGKKDRGYIIPLTGTETWKPTLIL